MYTGGEVWLAAPHVGAHPQVVEHGELREDAAPFGNVRNPGARHRLGAARPALAGERHIAVAAHRSGHGAQRRRLAGAVGSEERDDLALVDGEGDSVQCLHLPVARVDIAKLQKRCHLV